MRRPRARDTAIGASVRVALLLAVLSLPAEAWARQSGPVQMAPPVRPAAPASAEPASPAPACPPGVPERLCEPWPRGEWVDPVECRSDPGDSYALYLPSDYTPARFWPALIVLDARGRGRHAAERFQAAADRFGWLLASSNDSASDAGWEEISGPARALLADAPHRFAIDPRRIYLAGFSGTARGIGAIAANAGGGFPGVFLAGGGLPAELPATEVTFAVFAAAGSEDFNFPEIDALADPLAAAGVAHRVEIFDGPHAWPPEELAAEAIGWFELRAMAAGTRRFDPALAAELAAGWLEEAGERERAGETVGAFRLYRSTAADLADLLAALPAGAAPPAGGPPTLPDGKPAASPRADSRPPESGAAIGSATVERLRGLLAEARTSTGRLEASAALRRGLAERGRVAAWEEGRRRDLERVVQPLRQLDDQPPLDTLPRGARLIEKLRAEAAGDGARALAARRVLGLAAANTGFYLPRDLLPRGEYRRAATALELAVLIREDNAVAWYNLACARARLGQHAEALDALERAVAAGYRDADHLAADPDLESLHGHERFAALLAGLRAAAPAAGRSPS